MKSKKKKNKKGKKKSQKSKSKKQLKKGKGKKKLGKKKSNKKSKKKPAGKTVDTIQPSATLEVDDAALATTANKEMEPMQTTQSAGNGNYGSNYAVFEWNGSSWGVVEDCCNYGCMPQTPEDPGSFPGERTVTACRAMVEGMPCPPSE